MVNTKLPKPDRVFENFRIATMSDQVQGAYGIVEDHVLAIADGKIISIEPSESSQQSNLECPRVNGQGKLMSPGLIDCHTHLVYGGNRANEWEQRLNGKSYEEISRSGGGILSTVKATRSASESELIDLAEKRLKRLTEEGVTTVEIKSGYGLNLETELMMLRAARTVGERLGIHVEPTLLAAHALPPEFNGNADGYIDLVCQEIIPAAKGLCTSVDAFCETIAFDLAQTRRVFEAAIEHGFQIKVHAEQLSSMGAARLAAEMNAVSADHLEYLTNADCEILKRNNTVATLLPGAFYCLREEQLPPIAALRENKVPMAVATDSNPGSSPIVSLLLVANMACNLFGLTPEEAFAGITRNAARALRIDDIGTLEVGKKADLVCWNASSPAELVYSIGLNPIDCVYKSGIAS